MPQIPRVEARVVHHGGVPVTHTGRGRRETVKLAATAAQSIAPVDLTGGDVPRVELHGGDAEVDGAAARGGLQKEDSALLCMPLQYIAGKMVVIRALVAGLDLLPVTPSGHPLKDLTKAPVFAAMIPMQVYNSLQVPEEKTILQQIRHLIIGGGPIDSQLNAALKDFPHAVWSTYGMTETLSHIALRRLNGPEASDWYTPFESIQIRLSKENTLVIYAPEICEKELVTNDIAEINGQNQFRILGRKDNTINTGGVKVQIEQVEAALKEHLSVPFLITSAPDEKFGEIIVLLAEGQLPDDIEQTCTHQLPPYWRPKRFVPVFKLPLTETGKPDRAIAKLLAQK